MIVTFLLLLCAKHNRCNETEHDIDAKSSFRYCTAVWRMYVAFAYSIMACTSLRPFTHLQTFIILIMYRPNSCSIKSLKFRVLKIFPRIIYTWLYRKFKNHFESTLFGFRDRVATTEALFSINVRTKICRDMNVDVYARLIHCRKAFDCIQHQNYNRHSQIIEKSYA